MPGVIASKPVKNYPIIYNIWEMSDGTFNLTTTIEDSEGNSICDGKDRRCASVEEAKELAFSDWKSRIIKSFLVEK